MTSGVIFSPPAGEQERCFSEAADRRKCDLRGLRIDLQSVESTKASEARLRAR